jgi:hypothetical protein
MSVAFMVSLAVLSVLDLNVGLCDLDLPEQAARNMRPMSALECVVMTYARTADQ